MSDIALRELRKTFTRYRRADVEAVRGIDIEVGSGELLGLLGPSGCGKSTTLRMIAGLEQPTGGDITVDGKSITTLPAQRRNIGVAFENYALYPPLTVAENLAFGLTARGGLSRAEVTRRVRDMAERIGLETLLEVKPGELSSGQKQRVALARALVRHPDVLLLDEPLSHLDAAQRDITRRELKRLQRDLGYTTILVTHDQEEALSLADRIAVMKDGVIQQLGTPDEIYDSPANVFVADFVGEPAINLFPKANGEKVIVGIRPEDIEIVDSAGADATGTVVIHEQLLEIGLATVRVDGIDRPLAVQTDPDVTLDRDQVVHLRFNPARTHRFDAQTEVAIDVHRD